MIVRSLRVGELTSGMSRTAATMLSRLIRQEAPTTAMKVMTTPRE
jgi:hypothetical protein